MDRQHLRLLIVDDSDNDASLLERMLAQEGYDLTWERVDTVESLRRALRKSERDIIVSQCRLRRFSAYKVLEAATELTLDIPLIVVSETVDEMDVVALVKAGAVDFVKKDNLSLLASTVKREIRLAARRQEEKVAERQQQLLRLDDVEQANADARKISDENAVITEIGRVVTSTLNFDEICEQVASLVRSIVPYDRFSLGVLEDDGEHLKLQFVIGTPVKGFDVGTVFANQQSFSGNARRAGKGRIIDQMDSDTNSLLSRFQEPFYEAGLQYGMAIPLISNGNLIGSIVYRSPDPEAFHQHKLELAERVAALLAGALAAERLYRQVQRESSENEALAAIGRVMGSALDVKTIYDIAFDELKKLIPADRVTATLLMPDGLHMKINYISGVGIPGRTVGHIFLVENEHWKVINSRTGQLDEGHGPGPWLRGTRKWQRLRLPCQNVESARDR